MEQIIKVSSKSNPSAVAGMVTAMLKENKKAEIQAIGAGAVNQAVKAIAVARGYVAPMGYNLVCTPGFAEIKIDDEERSAIKFIVKYE
jgi:stage V sporulation protein S